MRGRASGNQERIIILAHQTAMMSRQERLKPLAKYLETPKTPATTGASAVLAMLRKFKKKQDKKASSQAPDL